MNPRDKDFLECYDQYRYENQRRYYHDRIAGFRLAHSQAVILTSILMGCAGIASLLATADIAQQRTAWVVLAVIFPALATAFTAYDRLHAFDQQAKLYHDAARALPRAHQHQPMWKTGSNADEFQDAIRAYVDEVELVLRSEQGQWGQLMSQVRPIDAAGGNTEQRGKID